MTKTGTGSVVLFGLESRYAHDVIDLLTACDVEIAASVPSTHDGEVAGVFPRLASREASELGGSIFVIPLLTPGRRKLRANEGAALGMFASLPHSHPTAVVSPAARLSNGSLIGAMAVIGAHVRAGVHFMMNRAATTGHDCRIGDYCSIGPSATLCGGCTLEDGVYVGAGAILCPKVTVGRNAVIGAGAVVRRHVKAGTVVAGNPARVIRRDVAGYRGIGV